MKKFFGLFLLGTALFLGACGGASKENEQMEAQRIEDSIKAAEAEAAEREAAEAAEEAANAEAGTEEAAEEAPAQN